jgi:hypothetical protein
MNPYNIKPTDVPRQPGITRRFAPPTRLHEAAKIGDVMAIQSLLAESADPNATTYFGFTPLHLVVREYAYRQRNFVSADRWAECARLLLEAGANPLLRCFPNTTAAGVGEGHVPPALRDAMVMLAEQGVWRRDDERGFHEVCKLAKRTQSARHLSSGYDDDEECDASEWKDVRPGERSAPRHRVSARKLDEMTHIARAMEDNEELDRGAAMPQHTRSGWWTARQKTGRQRPSYREIRSARAAIA